MTALKCSLKQPTTRRFSTDVIDPNRLYYLSRCQFAKKGCRQFIDVAYVIVSQHAHDTGRHMDAILPWPTSIWLEIERERMLLQLMDGPLRVVSCDVFAAVSTAVVVVALSARAVRASRRLVNCRSLWGSWPFFCSTQSASGYFFVCGARVEPDCARKISSAQYIYLTWTLKWVDLHTESKNTDFLGAFETAACTTKSWELDSFIHEIMSDYDVHHL